MKPLKFDNMAHERVKPKKEAEIQEAIVKKLRSLGWHVIVLVCHEAQHGLPDLYITHRSYGSRWVEIKRPEGYSFTPSQLYQFPLLCANGSGVWILTSDDDSEIAKLFKSSNWYQ